MSGMREKTRPEMDTVMGEWQDTSLFLDATQNFMFPCHGFECPTKPFDASCIYGSTSRHNPVTTRNGLGTVFWLTKA